MQAQGAPDAKKNPEITIIPIEPPPSQKGSGDEIEMPSLNVGSASIISATGSAKPKHLRPTHDGKDAKDPKKDARKEDLTRELVAGRFSAARREYAAFKDRNGDRLEKEWGDLATFITYQLTPGNLEDAMHRIESFRARLRE